MQTINITAADTLFFRDGRPFTMGEDTHADGLFPPPPSVLYGALRSAYMAKKLSTDTVADLIKETSLLTIKGLALVIENFGIHFPLPKDLVVPKVKDKRYKALPLDYTVASNLSSSLTPKTLKNRKKDKMQDGDFYLKRSAMIDYLNRDEDEFPCRLLPIEREMKVGIGRNNETHIATDGMLYRAAMQRPKEVSFAVQFDNLSLDTEGVLQLGGERKVAHFQSFNYQEVEIPTIEGCEFKIYLATPAIFKAGWQPTDILEEGCTIQAAAIGKPLHLGGFDIDKKTPKAMLQAVPAGSVYYVKAKDEAQAQRIIKKIEAQGSISEFYPEQGFGIAFIGKI